jgi:hypothetical protein
MAIPEELKTGVVDNFAAKTSIKKVTVGTLRPVQTDSAMLQAKEAL